MRVALKPHPDTPCAALSAIEVEVLRPVADEVQLSYFLTGDLSQVVLPPTAGVERVDELWKHTCFEAFIQPGQGEGYVELNVAPSSQWAAYQFSGYRDGMRMAGGIGLYTYEYSMRLDRVEASVCFVGLPADAAWRLAISAVIEEVSGAKSYWAVAHPAGKPDFHHRDGFVLDLPLDAS